MNGAETTSGGRSFLAWTAVVALGAAAGLGAYEYAHRFRQATYYDYGVLSAPHSAFWMAFWVPAVACAVVAAGRVLWRRRGVPPGRYACLLAPAVLLALPAAVPGVGLAGVLLFVAVACWVCFRVLAHSGLAPRVRLPSYRAGFAVFGCAAAALVLLAVFVQEKLYSLLSLGYSDFCIFWNVLRNTCEGRLFFDSSVGRSFLAEHFAPAGILLMVPFYWLAPGRTAVFLAGGVGLFAPCLIVYPLARKVTGSRAWAYTFAAAYLLYPSLSLLVASGTYGFHVVYLAIPFLFLSLWAYESGTWGRAVLCLLVAVLVKETVLITAAGLGLALFLTGRRKAGAVVAILALLAFVAVTSWVMPAFREGQAYTHVARFAHLGDSPAAILLSPITRPGDFWPCLLRWHVVYYGVLLVLPLAFFPLFQPRILAAAAPLFLFTCLQGNPELVSLNAQYQSSLIPILFYAAMRFVKSAREGSGLPAAWFWPAPSPGGGATRWLHVLLLAAAGLCAHSFGQSFYSRDNVLPLLIAEDYRRDIEAVRQSVPPGVRIVASQRLAAHFEGRNEVSLRDMAQWPPAFVVMDLDDHYSRSRASHAARHRMTAALGYHPVRLLSLGPRACLVYAREGARLQPASWAALPEGAVRKTVDAGEVRLHGWQFVAGDAAGSARLRLYVEALREAACDFRVSLYVPGEGGTPVRVSDKLLCNGVRPFWEWRRGDRFVHEVNAGDYRPGWPLMVSVRKVFEAE